MDESLIIMIVFIVVVFFFGNYILIDSLRYNSLADMSESAIFLIIAIVIDFILLYFIIWAITVRVKSSFRLMRKGLKNRRIVKKESAQLKEFLESEEPDVDRLGKLRDQWIDESAIKRTLHFCQLIEILGGKEELQDCLSEAREKQGILAEISDIENKIFRVAERCKDAGDLEKCRYYLDILMAKKKTVTPEITSLEEECEKRLFERKTERKAIRLWAKILLTAAICIVVFAALYIKNTLFK